MNQPSCPLDGCDGITCARAALGNTVATCVNQAGREPANTPRVVPYIVIRPAADLPDGFLPDEWNGRWITQQPVDPTVRTTVFGATAVAVDRYEQREDGVWAQVYEVRPPVPEEAS